MECNNCSWTWELESCDDRPYLCHKCGFDSKLKRFDMKALEKWRKEQLPFEEHYEKGYYIRTFDNNVENDELSWHRDREDRLVESVGDTDWLIQLDNQLPKPLTESTLIPKNTFHRVIKGSGDLKVKIKKIIREEIDDFEWMDSSINGRELRELIDKNKATTIPFQHVVGDLYLMDTQIKDLGNLKSVVGNLDLRRTPTKDLGNLQSVSGYLDLEGTQIKDLGNLESVGGDLDLYETPIKDLGNLKSVVGSLYLEGTPISKKYSEEEIRQQVNVGGEVYM